MSLPFLRTGVQLLSEYCANGRMLKTGVVEIDQLIGGGICTGQVMEITGPTLSGKTHICHVMTAHVAASHPPALGHRVLYIDCAGQFSVARLLSFVEKECRCEKEAGDSEEFHVAQTMRRVSVARCLNLTELVNGFEKLFAEIKRARKSMLKVQLSQASVSSSITATATSSSSVKPVLPELIVIDCLTSAFALMPLGIAEEKKPERSVNASANDNNTDDSLQRNKEVLEHLMAKLSLLVRQVANLGNLAVVVTNPVPVPQMLFTGSYYNAWTFAAHIRISLDIVQPQGKYVPRTKNENGSSEKLRRFAVLKHHAGSRGLDELTDEQNAFSIAFNLLT